MKSNRVVFLGTPEFARFHLEALLNDKSFELVGVVTQPDRPSGRKMELKKSPVKLAAEAASIPVISPESIRNPEIISQIQAWRPDVVIVVAYGQIIPRDFLALFPNRVVNVHGSLLPRWRGAAPIQRAIMAGDKVSGVSLQVMVYELDAGDVVGERSVALSESITSTELYDQLQVHGVELLKNELLDFLRGDLVPRPQDAKKVSLAPKIAKSEALIRWDLPAGEVHNLIRGLSMGPFAYSTFAKGPIKIHRTEVLKSNTAGARPGEVITAEGDNLMIACGQGVLRVLEIQPESRAKMDVRSFLAGHPIKKGDHFG